jgi:streptomycin 6-kinase
LPVAASKTLVWDAMPAKTLFLGRDDANCAAKSKKIAPQLEIVSRAQLNEKPNLLSQIEIAYGGLNRDQIARATALKWFQNGALASTACFHPKSPRAKYKSPT